MGKTLTEIAQQLRDAAKKVQLIYAFNGVGKTRLSREFKQLIVPKGDGSEGDDAADQPESARLKVLYYSAFTEDLFYWDNDLEDDVALKLKIQPNSFTDWVLREQGQDQNIITAFQSYSSNRLTPRFNEEYSEVTFSLERGDDAHLGNLKISKGEESNFIWSIFYTLLDQVISCWRDSMTENTYKEPQVSQNHWPATYRTLIERLVDSELRFALCTNVMKLHAPQTCYAWFSLPCIKRVTRSAVWPLFETFINIFKCRSANLISSFLFRHIQCDISAFYGVSLQF